MLETFFISSSYSEELQLKQKNPRNTEVVKFLCFLCDRLLKHSLFYLMMFFYCLRHHTIILVVDSTTQRYYYYANSYFWNSKRHRRLWAVGGASISSQHLNFRPTTPREGNHFFKKFFFIIYNHKHVVNDSKWCLKLFSQMECDGFQKFFTQFSFSLGFGAVMTFSHMDTGELINLGRPPPLRSPNRGSPSGGAFITHSYSNLWRMYNALEV